MLVTEVTAQRFTILGSVKDSLTGESLIGAYIYINDIKQGVTTNSYGFYSITIPNGEYELSISYVGYKTAIIEVIISKTTFLDINLAIQHKALGEVMVKGNKTTVESSNVSKNEITIERLSSIPTATGESDVLKALQMMPGIQAANEGATNLYVRGGSADQNLYLLDEAPVYNPSHSLGFFSSFNTQALKKVEIYKGCFPARFGGRLSSVVDIKMRDGNYYRTNASVNVDLIASHLAIEGPIMKGKFSYLLAARYSNPGAILNLISYIKPNSINNLNKIWFYDLNAKLNFNINSNNHLFFSMYSGYDNFYCYVLNNKNDLNWGNYTSTIRWNHLFTNKLFVNFTTYQRNYNYSYYIHEDIRNFIWKARIIETGIKSDFSYYLNPLNNIKFGTNFIYHEFEPGSIHQFSSNSIVKNFSLEKKYSLELIFYFENEHVINSNFAINYGVRSSLFLNYGPGTVYTYNNIKTIVTDSSYFGRRKLINNFNSFEPRVFIRYKINDRSSMKFGYSYSTQYLHLLSNSTVGLPTDIWLPPDKNIGPQFSNQYVVGYYKTFSNNGIELSIETYYKNLINVIDFKDNADLFLNKHIETQILKGKGTSFGFEFLVEKKFGKASGWLSYTLAKTQYKVYGANQDKWYPPPFDIRHNITITGNYKINQFWDISTNFRLISGGYTTLPKQVFYIDGAYFFDYGTRNSYKLPFYHRLDLSASYYSKKNEKSKIKKQWNFSIYNIYNRKNIYSIFVKQSLNLPLFSSYKMYLFGIVPTVSFSLKL